MATLIAVTVDLHPSADTATQTIEVPSDIKWSDFELMLRLMYDLDTVVVKYVDEDNDQVTISSHEELTEAFRVARSQLHTLQLKLFCPPPYPGINPAMNTAMRAATNPGTNAATNAPRPEPAPRRPGIAKPVVTSNAIADNRGDNMMTDTSCRPVTMNAIAADRTDNVISDTSSSMVSSDDSSVMEGVESNKDTASSPDSPRARCFFLRHATTGLVLDVEGWAHSPGTRVILWEQKHGRGHHWTNYSCENQLFVEDEETCSIRSSLCGLCVEATESGVTLQPYSADRETQKWKVVGSRIQNGADNYNWVIGLSDTKPAAMTYQANPNQHWEVQYVDAGTGAASGGRPCGSKGHHIYKELAEEMARQMSSVAEDSPIPEGVPPTWFNAYMEKFKRDVCEEISTLVTRKTVRQVLAALHQHPAAAAAAAGAAGGATSHSQQPNPAVQHYGITCDSCDLPITGVRYKCGNCEDFDLCEVCEATVTETQMHDQNHVFIKLRRAAIAVARRKTGRPAPLLKRPLYPTEEDIRRLEEKILRKHEKHRRRGEKHEEKQKRREEKLKRRHEVHRDTPSKKEKLDMPHGKGCERMDAEFVEDENFPDGSRVVPDRPITKRWVMKNTGLCSWDSNTKLSLMWGNIPVVKSEVDVAPTAPNETCTVSVQLITPTEPGVYQSHWRMSHKNVRFGHRVWCSIIVVRPRQDNEEAGEESETTEVQQDDRFQHWVNGVVVCDSATGNATRVLLPQIKTEPDVTEPKVTEPEVTEPEVTEPKVTEPEVTVAEVTTPEVTEEAARRDQEQDDELMVEDMMAHTSATPAKEQKSAAEVDLLSAQDILSFEMLDIRDRNTPKVSQTATPTNTPMAMTPPKSPTRELEEGAERHLSTSSSVEVVSESSEESTSHMTELVQERIAKLGLRQDHFDDLETISTCSEDSNDDSESDFYIVPLPDCFNPSRPLSASTTSIVLTREEVQKTVDDILMASKSLDAPSLVPDTVSADDKNSMEVVDMTKEDTLDDVSLLAFEMPPTEGVKEAVGAEAETETPVVVEVAVVTEQAAPQESDQDAPVEILTDENANSVPTTPESSTDTLTLQAAPAPGVAVVDLTQEEEEGATAANPITLDADQQEKKEEEKPAQRPSVGSIPIKQGSPTSSQPGTPPSPTVLASSLMTAALGVASQAAATAYTTAKDVFHTLQANNQYVPPKSTWKPTQQKWTPPKQDFTLPKETWSPPQQTWTPPQPTPLPPSVVEEAVPAPAAPSSPMQQLVEMGFANRQLNLQLLEKHAQDVQKVVQELVSSEDNNWHQARH